MPTEYFDKKRLLNGSLDDFIITKVGFDRSQKKLVSFCVLQLHYSGENKHEIIRFDSAHGYCHVHRFYQRLDDEGKKIKGRTISQTTFDECRQDIKNNWTNYKKLYITKWFK